MDSSVLDRLALGDHVCVLDDAVDESVTAMGSVVARRIEAHHKVVCFGESNPTDLLAAADRHGIDVDAARRRGQLEIVTKVPRAAGFDPIATVAECARRVADRGAFDAVCLLTDMTWALRDGVPVDGLIAFESLANSLYTDGTAVGVCRYDRRLLTDRAALDIVSSHTGAVHPATETPWEPSVRWRFAAEGRRLVLSGHADTMNRRALAAMLDHALRRLAGSDERLTIDLDELTFVDASCAHVLLAAERRNAPRVRLVGGSSIVCRMLGLLG